jgi:hypothetical protein
VTRVSARNLFPAPSSHSDPRTQNYLNGRGFGSHINYMIAVDNGGYARVWEDAARLAIGTVMKARAG